MARRGRRYARPRPPWPRPKSLAAGPHGVFKQALILGFFAGKENRNIRVRSGCGMCIRVWRVERAGFAPLVGESGKQPAKQTCTNQSPMKTRKQFLRKSFPSTIVVLLLFIIPASLSALGQVPRIDSVNPNSGHLGTPITISGANFSPTPADN